MNIPKSSIKTGRSFEACRGPSKKPRPTAPSSNRSELPTNHPQGFGHLKPVERRIRRVRSEPKSSPTSIKLEKKAGLASPTPSILNRVTDYDEGMYHYTEPAQTEENPRGSNRRAAACLYNLAQACIQQGDYGEAAKWLQTASCSLNEDKDAAATPPTRMRLFKIMHNLGFCAYQLGSLDDSQRFYCKARSICTEAKLGAEHLAATDVALAVLLFHTSQDNMDIALRLMKSTLPVVWTQFGSASKQVGTLLNNIGRTHYMLGNYEEAALAYEESLDIRLKCLKRDSIDVAATICNAGRAYHQQGCFDKAITCYKEFLAWLQRHPEANQRDFVIVSTCLAEVLRTMGDHAKAKATCEKALTVGKAALGLYHPEVVSACCMLASLLYELEDYEGSLHYYVESLCIEKVLLLDGCHERMVTILANIAQIHRHRQDPRSAFLAYGEIYSLQVQLHGPSSLVLASTLSDMGLMEYEMTAYTPSLFLYQATLSIQRDHYESDDNLCIATTINSIGLVLYYKGDHGLARHCFVQSLKIREKLLGSDHSDVAVSWYNVATVYLRTGYEDLAIEFYKEVLRIERFALDVSELQHLTVNYLGFAYQARGDIEQALDYFSEALEIERTLEGNEGTIGKLLNLIGNIHLSCGNIPAMMQCYAEAVRLLRRSGGGNEALIISGLNYYGISKLHPPCAALA